MSDPERRARAHFDADAWEADLARTSPAGRGAASAARREYEQRGVPISQLRRVARRGRDGTELPNCVKVYVPPPAGRFGMVFTLTIDGDGRPVLAYLAFGARHHPRDSRAATVYQHAHERLRGSPPRH
ncbi:MAG: hypothetical protein ACRDLP_16385 [Solirubrobacteraceae bacterium]